MTDVYDPFAPAGGEAIKLDVGQTVHLMVTGYKVIDDQYNPGQKVGLITGRLQDGTDGTLWLSKKALGGAIGGAMKAAGNMGAPENGAILTVTRIEDGVAKQGQNAPHLFTAEYKRPSAEQQASNAAPAPEPAPAPVAAAPDPADFFG